MTKINATKVLSTLTNPDKILPVAMIEVATTAGRVYQGYKRGGEEEGRERLREETSTAVFWLLGVKVLNSIGDFIGEKIGIKNLNVDVGRDELRAPYLNIPDASRFKTCAYKFGKIIGSAAIATALTGFILPKVNHMITNASRKKKGLEPVEDNFIKRRGANKDAASEKSTSLPAVSMADFVEKAKNNAKNLSFKGAAGFANGAINLMSVLSHNIENTTAGRLMSTDAGMIAGRVTNSRNKFEGMEFLFRDTASIYFYLFAAPNAAALLGKMTNTPYVQPDALEVVKNHLIKSIGSNSLNPEEFKARAKVVPDNIAELLSKVPFNNKGVISLDEFNAVTKDMYKETALKMSGLQPDMGGIKLLSKQQAADVLSDGWICDPEFLKNAVNAGTYGKALDKNKFIPRKAVEDIISSVGKFTDSLIETAKNGNKCIDAKFIEDFTKKTMRTNLAFRIAGMVFAGFGLAYLIPKLQYKITEIRTGSTLFPGTADYSDTENVKN